MNKIVLFLLGALLSFSGYAMTWQETEQKAKGQNVYFHAWGGSQEINAYLKWVAKELKASYGIYFHHVKVTDIAKTTALLLAEKTAAKNSGGSVDMVWINGENFKSMKNHGLLYGPFTTTLPGWQYIDKSLPVESDFSEPTNGMEAPWGIGQLVFIHDSETVTHPPASFSELLSYSKAHPNRISYPKPPEFHGTAFLKALLIELTNSHPSLYQAVNQADFAAVTKPLWQYLDELHQTAWRKGEQFPAGSAAMIQLLDDRQLDLAMTFNPNAVFSAQNNGTLPVSAKAYAMNSGALSNIHFLAIPWNATAKEGALVAINFLLSPEAQSRKGALDVWGDPSVLAGQYLSGSAKNTRLFSAIAEPHPSWQAALETEWLKRYGN